MTITRSEVLRRARTMWPENSVPYSQSKLHPGDGYRQDCSGYVSMALGIPLNAPGSWGGLNTVSFVTNGYIHEINPNDLKPGDLIGRCGPGTAGDDGHIQIFLAWLNTNPNDNGHYVLEQTGGRSGWHKTLYSNWHSGYKAYRFRDISDDVAAPAPPAPQPNGRPAPGPAVAFPLPQGYYFGPASGPYNSISGLYGERYNGRLAIEWLQMWADQLARRGWPVGKGQRWLGQFGNDGKYGSEYDALARAFQQDQHLTVDGEIGANTWWAAYHNPIL